MGRGRGLALLAVVATVLGVAGCASAPTVGDGSLGVTWATLPTPAVPTPKAGQCTGRGTAEGLPTVSWDMALFNAAPVSTVDCSAEHVTETFFVGTFPPDGNTDVPARPKLGTALFRSAYESCAQQANDFLGGDFHTARVAVRPVMPTERQWAGNARWYRCEAMEVSNANGSINPRTSSLKDGLRGDRPLAITCGNESLSQDQKYIENITYITCDTEHDVELTGIYLGPDDAYPGDTQVQTAALDACYGIGAAYLGLTRAGLDSTGGIRWLFWGGSSDFWSVGDRSHRCFMGEFPRRKLTGSIKGRKPGTFPH
jgi:Septum formation